MASWKHDSALIEQVRHLLGGTCPDSLDETILKLRDKRNSIPSYKPEEKRDNRFSFIDEVLVKLFVMQRTDTSSQMEPCAVAPSQFDVLISDIHDSDFDRMASDVGCARLTPASGTVSMPVEGIVYGPSRRIFLPLTISRKTDSQPLHVIFLVDTGAPCTYLRQDTFEALGFKESIPSSTNIYIHGFKLPVALSHAHFETVDLLGQDFLALTRSSLYIDYAALTCIFGATMVRGDG